MIKELRQSLFQVFTLSLLWVALLLTLFYQGETVRVSLLWNAAGIAGIAAVVFSVMYNGFGII
ncbi:hypothetical protein [Paenibacillus hubeiensis]|uniref:hypothetical protein n=1 Tax=Paenibacillus hubeiensis TaxID=3077330 RepID=UPI0031BB4B2A